MEVSAILVATEEFIPREERKKFYQMLRPTIFEHMISTCRRAGIQDLVLVSEPEDAPYFHKLVRLGLTFLTREDTEGYVTGLRYLADSCERVLLWPVDTPFVFPETIRRLIDAPEGVIVPFFEGNKGHIAGMDMKTAKRLLADEPVEVCEIKSTDAFVIRQVFTRKAYEKMRRTYHPGEIHMDLKARLVNGKAFFGPGTMTLLTQIDRLGSIREACEKTGISYSKGRSMIHTAEEGCGFRLVERTSGGRNGGEALLTPKCRKLMDAYHTCVDQLEQTGEELCRMLFIDGDVFSFA